MVSLDEIKPDERMQRMRESFSQDFSILAEDYEHFTGISQRDAPMPLNTNSRKSGEVLGPLDQARN